MIEKLARIRDTHGVVLPELDLGGGHGAEPGHGIRLFRDIGDA
ncbi:diaminopimelate decarboxylase [Streptosporangium album]|uniref:Diaminopimelate decarboxylase n=1 Tax=Streptosporangium album TaxID=47479 RepID=A0A7W7W9S9_9ACTN|nr:hypothetical protein [Streptosporangium album]MBB4939223.1 diaminopimelate decarboxylase [Streptosporangium album]